MSTQYKVWTSEDGNQYHILKSEKHEVVEPCEVLSFGVNDARGRAVGMTRAIGRKVADLYLDEEETPRFCRLLKLELASTYYVGTAHSTRNGEIFGGSDVVVQGNSLEEVSRELDKRIARARALAVKKFGK